MLEDWPMSNELKSAKPEGAIVSDWSPYTLSELTVKALLPMPAMSESCQVTGEPEVYPLKVRLLAKVGFTLLNDPSCHANGSLMVAIVPPTNERSSARTVKVERKATLNAAKRKDETRQITSQSYQFSDQTKDNSRRCCKHISQTGALIGEPRYNLVIIRGEGSGPYIRLRR